MKTIFEREGGPGGPEANTPLRLSEDAMVWFVRTGPVDVFAIAEHDGRTAGPRMHLFRAEEGQVLFGVRPSSEMDLHLFAIGRTGCEVSGLRRERWQELCCKDPECVSAAQSALAAWVASLSTGVQSGVLPRKLVYLENGQETLVEEGACVSTEAAGVVWVRQVEGRSLFAGKEGLPDTGPGDLFPLCGKAFLQARSQAKYLALETGPCLIDGSCWSALALFHEQVLKSIELNMAERDAEERLRLDAKDANERAEFENSLRRLSSILQPNVDVVVPGGGEHNLLIAACRLIGEKQGIDFKTPPDGIPSGVDAVEEICHASRIRRRSVILKGDWWTQDSGPLLGFTEGEGSPVAIVPAADGYEICNPSSAARCRATLQTALELQPTAYMFYRTFPERALGGMDLVQIGLHGCRKDILAVLLAAVMGAVLALATPLATGIVFDTFIPDAAKGRLVQTALILCVCLGAGFVFELTKAISVMRVESKLDASLQAGIMDRLLSLPAPFFRKFTAGDLADRTLGINEIRRIMSGVAIETMLTSIFSFFYFVLMFWYSTRLALMASGLALTSVVVTCLASLAQVSFQRRLIGIQGQIFGTVLQFITGISKIRLSGTENRAFAVWAELFGRQRTIGFKAGVVSSLLASFNSAFPVLSLAVLFFWLSSGKADQISPGSFLGFIAAFSSLQFALIQLSSTLVSTLCVAPIYERAKPILETSPEVDFKKSHPGVLTGDIEISHACFRYSAEGPLVLDDVSLRAKPGEFIALAGDSGSGKSTLLRLLLGFEAAESGGVYYDGRDLSGMDLRAFRRQIGVVLQNGRIMAGDIFRNIVGSSNLTIDDAWEAARMAGFDADIKKMPMGMHTIISAGSTTLSGGQKQRLMIARAVVRRPRIILFDEATSALDNITQSIVSRSLEGLRATRIVIAHRLSTIINADLIFVLERGRIVQSGNYEQLMALKGPFQELAKRQLL